MIATYQRTIFEKGDFSICAFKPENEQEPPQSAVRTFHSTLTAHGNPASTACSSR